MFDIVVFMLYLVIIIDGLIVFGKGMVVYQVVDLFGFYLLDSGLLYWLVVFVSMCENIDDYDVESFVCIVCEFDVCFKVDYIWFKGEDVSLVLWYEFVGNQVLVIVVYGVVWEVLYVCQCVFLEVFGFVVDGCDMGMVVFFEVVFKVFLMVSVQVCVEWCYK